MAMRLFVAD
ncbi:hypothetical protein LINPERPRIM_LOCUS16870 [Linum perenne]